MDKGTKTVLIIGGIAALGGTALAIALSKPTKAATPPGGAASFTIKVVNLPAGATSWGCAFKDPATGIYYQPTNHPIAGLFTFNPSALAQMSAPMSSGILSISAFAAVIGGESVTNLPAQLVNYQVPISVNDGRTYTFDFSDQSFG